jgi:hypothetical protein
LIVRYTGRDARSFSFAATRRRKPQAKVLLGRRLALRQMVFQSRDEVRFQLGVVDRP